MTSGAERQSFFTTLNCVETVLSMTAWTRHVTLVIRAHFLFCKSLLRCSRDLRLVHFVLISILLFPGNCEIHVRHDRHHLLSPNFYHRTDYGKFVSSTWTSLQIDIDHGLLDLIYSVPRRHRILELLDRKRGTDTTTICSTILFCVCSYWMSFTTLFCTEWDEVCCSVSVPLDWASLLPYLTPDYRRHRITWYYHDWSPLLDSDSLSLFTRWRLNDTITIQLKSQLSINQKSAPCFETIWLYFTNVDCQTHLSNRFLLEDLDQDWHLLELYLREILMTEFQFEDYLVFKLNHLHTSLLLL